MTGAAQRAALAAIGRDIAARGNPGQWRAAGLASCDTPAPPADFGALASAPDWLKWSHGDLDRLALAVALRSIAPALATSIDGNWLGSIAATADEAMLDWAIAEHDGRTSSASDMLAADALRPRGFAILKAALPPGLRGWLAVEGDAATPAQPRVVEDALAYVGERSR